jgi:hypothetical protein
LVKHRGTLTLVALAILAAASLVVGLQVHAWLYRLPEPATADRDGLVRWLVLADLSEQPDDTCRTLVDRFEAIFGDTSDVSASAQDLDPSALSTAQVDQVERNVARLKKVWFFARVDEYAALPREAQAAFLDRQICNIFRCAEVDRRLDAHDQPAASGSAASAPPDVGNYVGSFFDALGQWRAEAPESKQDAIHAAVKHGLIRWLATHDLAEHSASVRRQVVAGLEKELGTKLNFGDSTSTLTPAETKRFWHNVEVLAEAWFHAKANEFAGLAANERTRFVVEQLAVADELAAHWPHTTTKGATSPSGAAAIAGRLKQWIATADESQRDSAREFAGALQSAWVARKFGALFRGG